MSVLHTLNANVSTTAVGSSAPRSPRETPIQVTQEDLLRLNKVVERHLDGTNHQAAEMLEFELYRASVVSQREVASNVVTMRSKVIFEDIGTGARREAVLVYPEEADLSSSKVSVLAPVGMALLGIAEGETISWPMPAGRSRTLRVISVEYQPEAAGDFQL